MNAQDWLLVATLALYLYSTGGSWMLQRVAYPTYELVGSAEFVPFHVASGQRMMPVFVFPAILACMLSFALVLLRPTSAPLWSALIVAACSLIILLTTVLIEVPKHNRLDREGKSSALIAGLVRDNLPRALSWTVGSALLLYMLLERV